MRRLWMVVCASGAAMTSLAAPVLAGPPEPGAAAPAGKPAIFSDKPFADAVAASKTGGKITVVKATADWCAPCKRMDKTTFVDDKVVKWFGDNGLIIEFDVDKDPKLAGDLNVRAMPTTIAFKDGKEVDRIVGYRDAAGLLSWLESVKTGRPTGDGMTTTIEKTAPAEDLDKLSMPARQQRAQALVKSGRFAEAADEYSWLWQNMHKRDPATRGVRGSFLVNEMKSLIAQHPPAGDRFKPVRDFAWDSYAANREDLDAFADWATLNSVVGEDAKTVEWFDTAKADPAQAEAMKRASGRLEQLLIKQGRTADLVSLYADPLEPVQAYARMKAEHLDTLGNDENSRVIRQVNQQSFRGKVSNLYAALLLNKRDDDAARLAAEAIKADDTPATRIALVQTALDAKTARPEHTKWLDEAAAGGGGSGGGEQVDALRAKLQEQTGTR